MDYIIFKVDKYWVFNYFYYYSMIDYIKQLNNNACYFAKNRNNDDGLFGWKSSDLLYILSHIRKW